jgi:hypothetical protein
MLPYHKLKSCDKLNVMRKDIILLKFASMIR